MRVRGKYGLLKDHPSVPVVDLLAISLKHSKRSGLGTAVKGQASVPVVDPILKTTRCYSFLIKIGSRPSRVPISDQSKAAQKN